MTMKNNKELINTIVYKLKNLKEMKLDDLKILKISVRKQPFEYKKNLFRYILC